MIDQLHEPRVVNVASEISCLDMAMPKTRDDDRGRYHQKPDPIRSQELKRRFQDSNAYDGGSGLGQWVIAKHWTHGTVDDRRASSLTAVRIGLDESIP
jgi:hypothetical protein